MRYRLDVGTALTDMTGGGAAAGTYTLNLCNRGEADAKIRLAVTAVGQAPTNADYLEFDATLKPKGVLARWPFAIEAGERVYVSSSVATVSANLIGRSEA
ncbi:MAG: hypothetical protein R3184_01920 [Aurantimonas coralicida]|nr:hypothetical protein [Aurantimonas coralicida]